MSNGFPLALAAATCMFRTIYIFTLNKAKLAARTLHFISTHSSNTNWHGSNIGGTTATSVATAAILATNYKPLLKID